jgi:hypothetical protein
MRAGLLIRGAAASGAVTVAPMPAGRGLAPLADIPDRQRRDGFSQLVVRREYSVIPMPVLPRRRDEIGQLGRISGEMCRDWWACGRQTCGGRRWHR